MDRNLWRVSSLLWQLLLDSRQQWDRWFSVEHPEFITLPMAGGSPTDCLRVLVRTGHPGESDRATTAVVACYDIENDVDTVLSPVWDWDVAAANLLFDEWKKQSHGCPLDAGLIAAHVAAKFDPSVAAYVTVNDRGLGWFRATISTGRKNGPITHVGTVSAEVHGAADEDVVAEALFDAWKKRYAPCDHIDEDGNLADGALDSDGKLTQDALRAELKLVESRERDAKRECTNLRNQLATERDTVGKLRARLADLELQLLHYGDLRKLIDQVEAKLSKRIREVKALVIDGFDEDDEELEQP